MRVLRFLMPPLIMVAMLCAPAISHAASDAPSAAAAADNEEVHEIYVADQKDRESLPVDGKFDAAAVASRDKARHARMTQLLAQGLIRTATDHVRAAYIFQHGDSADSIRLAHALATIASAKDPSRKEARWLMAASWDRLMVRLERPQWYGTQFNRIGDTGPYSIDPVDERMTDAERASFFVPPLAEMRKHLEEVNRGQFPSKQ